MYEAFFGLEQRPFAATPAPASYVPTTAMEQARQTLARGIERAEGPGLVVGAAGTGKTQLLVVLAEQFAEGFAVALLSGSRLRTVRALLQNILFELGLPYRGLSEGELRLALLDHLQSDDCPPQGLLVLVDEAHILPAVLLDELRMLTNLVRGGSPRVRLVMAGDLRLEERLANPRLSSFLQRIAARCYLSSLERDDTLAFVRAQFTAAGRVAAEIIDDNALSAIHRLADGVPRLVNQLCDHALILAAVASQRRLTLALVEEAWADLQQLPSPTVAPPPSSADNSAVIEFGPLDEPVATTSTMRFDAPIAPRSAQRDPLEQLDAVERHLAALASDNFDDFAPLARATTEIELSFASPHSPFGGVYDEEEVVIDRYASLEAKTLRTRPQVSSREGREIAALMGQSVPQRRKLGIVASGRDEAGEAPDLPFDPGSDPVMPEYYPQFSENISRHALAAQSPELVVIDRAREPSPPPLAPPGRAQRQEYRQLFARLRRGG